MDDGTRWYERAACRGRDVNMFFPEAKDGESVGPGLAFCMSCSVRSQCGTEALDRGEQYGIWGGMTPRQLRAARRRRQRGVPSQVAMQRQ